MPGKLEDELGNFDLVEEIVLETKEMKNEEEKNLWTKKISQIEIKNEKCSAMKKLKVGNLQELETHTTPPNIIAKIALRNLQE